MSPAGFEAAILSSEQPQAYALDHAAAGIDTGFEPMIPSIVRLQTYTLDSTATEVDQLNYSMNVIM